MKKNLFLATCVSLTFLLSVACLIPNDTLVSAYDRDTKLPDWQWTSGEVKAKTTASKQPFTIFFGSSIYQPGDSVSIIFYSYKVSFTGITPETTFKRWQADNRLVYSFNNVWVPLVMKSNSRINGPFAGALNNRTDSLLNYEVRTVVPGQRKLILSVTPGNVTMNFIDGHGKPMFTNGFATLTTSIKGIEVKKL
ncbi:MAG TPA: hypothetical protein VNZ45_03525 [Bacteroidia bacterium]|jgi:hypothetical protein|nr:hypothetical protein [Bacteroidia bacterium]